MASRIPAITIWFWLVKTLISGADIAWPDYVYSRLGLVATNSLIGIVLAATLAAQLRTRRYRGWIFWPAMVAVSVAGTEAANGAHTQCSMPYWAVAAVCLGVLAAVLTRWRTSETTLSLRSIDTRRREGFFWAAALAGFALGTAVAHLAVVTTAGLMVWLAVTGAIALTWRRFRSSALPAFWVCFIVTRPLGTWTAVLLASRYNVVVASALLGLIVVGIVAYLAMSGRDILELAGASGPAPGEDGRRPAPIPQRVTSETPKQKTL